MKTKADLEKWYSKEDPWGYINTIPDKIRRAILLRHIEVVFFDGLKKTVLDAGCGEGYLTRDIASKYNADIDAFDISENALAVARRRNSHEKIRYFQLDLNDYVPDKKYDLIMCEESLYYLTDDERISAIRKFHDSLNTQGYLKVSTITIGETPNRNYFTLDSIRELLAGNGFEIVSIMPSVIQNRSPIEKIFYRSLKYLNKLKLVSPNLMGYLTKMTVGQPLDNCYAVSLLSKRI